jgi:diketogulonate reductase-like aldo/keto reductase
LPHIGFGVAGHIEHKEIPLIVSRLLQYASSENEGGGGIALVDAVMDERVDHGETKEEEKFETNMSKTVVALVGRAISFFAKENMNNHWMEVKPDSVKVGEDNKSPSSYDYENRLEVHLLVCLSDSELGRENSMKALSDITAELEGLVPPAPHNLDHLDSTSWKANVVDRRVDTRLHVLLRLPECYNADHQVVPCSSDETANSKLLQQWIDSWGVLEKLYEANILHGIGVDGTTEGDLKLLLKHCRIAPQIYRGDVSQALDSYGRKMGVHTFNEERRVEKLLKEKNITFLASNVAGHVLEKKDQAPNAHGLLQILGKILFHSHRESVASQGGSISNSNEEYYTVPRLALAYLVRHGVVALPHAYKPEHLADDAPESVGGLASFLTERSVAEIGAALKALVTGRDLPEEHGLGTEDEDSVAIVFHNELDEDVTLMQLVHENKMVENEIERGIIEKGDSVVIIAKPGDEFEVFRSDGSRFDGYQVHAERGGAEDHTISSKK